MFRITYYDRDGSGYCNSNEPWIFDDSYKTQESAEEDRDILIEQGFKNVKIEEIRACV